MDLVMFKKHGKVVADTPFFATLIQSMEQEATASGYHLGIRYTSADTAITSTANGVILLGTEMTAEDLHPYLQLSMPLVILDNNFPSASVNTVAIDNFGGEMLAVEHFVASGHKKIGYLAGSEKISNFEERYQGFLAALRKYNLEPVEVITLPPNIDGASAEMTRYLETNKLKATAYCADNDFIALGAMMGMRGKYAIGKEISVIGFDDLPYSRVCDPELTTIRVFNDMLGAAAVKRVVELCKTDESVYTHSTIGVELKIRSSVVKIK